MLNVAVVYIFFNRPEAVRKTFPLIRAQQPSKLYLIADGPRASRPTDEARCRETREVVESLLDWKCEVTRDYSPVNLGCGRRLSSGLTRAFAELGEAIILEDDVLPHPDFFSFCEAHLERHRDNPQIHAISGFNPLGRYAPSAGPAVPTTFNCIWGWASWQRAWKDYQFDIAEWKEPSVKERIRAYVRSPLNFQHFASSFDKLFSDEVDTWDFQWTFTMLKHRRIALVSSVNFIENLGFDTNATHTHAPEPYIEGLHTYPAVATSRARPVFTADPIHDKLYGEVILTPSKRKIFLARLIARSAFLQRLLRSKLS